MKDWIKRLVNNAWFMLVTWNVLFFGGVIVGSADEGGMLIGGIWLGLFALWIVAKYNELFTP